MNPALMLSSLQRACRVNPAARRATLWQIAKDPEGRQLEGPGGEYQWRRTCAAWVIFTYDKPDDNGEFQVDFAGGYKASVLPDPVSANPFQLPDLGESFMIWRSPRMMGDPIPELTLTMHKIGADGMGLSQQYRVRVPDSSEYGPVFIGPLPII